MNQGNNGSNLEEMEKKLNNLEEKFLMGKIREKKFMINIHKKEREIRQLKSQIHDIVQLNQMYQNSLPTEMEDESIQQNQDILYDINLNNEFISMRRSKSDIDQAITALEQKNQIKQFEKAESQPQLQKQYDIIEKYQKIQNKNKELGTKISKELIDNMNHEIENHSKLIQELKDDLVKVRQEILEIYKNQKYEIDTISSYTRLLKEQQKKNKVLQENIELIQKKNNV